MFVLRRNLHYIRQHGWLHGRFAKYQNQMSGSCRVQTMDLLQSNQTCRNTFFARVSYDFGDRVSPSCRSKGKFRSPSCLVFQTFFINTSLVGATRDGSNFWIATSGWCAIRCWIFIYVFLLSCTPRSILSPFCAVRINTSSGKTRATRHSRLETLKKP